MSLSTACITLVGSIAGSKHPVRMSLCPNAEERTHLIHVQRVRVVVRAVALIVGHAPRPGMRPLPVVPASVKGRRAVVLPPVLCEVRQDLRAAPLSRTAGCMHADSFLLRRCGQGTLLHA